jgi:hypothetical protein
MLINKNAASCQAASSAKRRFIAEILQAVL